MIGKSLLAPVLLCSVLFAPVANALPTNGTLEVPNDISPGDYWGTPGPATDFGSVEICSNSVCDPGNGFIDGVFVNAGRHLVHVPGNTKYVHLNNVNLVKK